MSVKDGKGSRDEGADSARRALAGDGGASGLPVVARPRIQERLRDAFEGVGLVLICAPERMGKSSIVTHEELDQRRRGVTIIRRNLGLLGQDEALNVVLSLSRCRRVSGVERRPTLVILEDIPVGGDRQIIRMAGALSDLRDTGAMTLVTVDAAISTFSDVIGAACCLGTRDLLVSKDEYRRWSKSFESCTAAELERITHGMPSLVDVARTVGPISTASDIIGSPSFESEVSRVSSKILAGTLDSDARRMRAAMILLRSGDFDELGGLGVEIEQSAAAELEERVPILGVDADRGTFECVPAGGASYSKALVAAGVDHALAVGAIERLVVRGDYDRAGMLAHRLLHPGERTALVLTHPIEMVDSGSLGLVRGVLADEDGSSKAVFSALRFGSRVAAAALACAEGTRSELEQTILDVPEAGAAGERRVREQLAAMTRARTLDVCLDARSPGLEGTEDIASGRPGNAGDFGYGYLVHERAKRWLYEGNPRAAFRLLLTCGVPRDGRSLLSSMLCRDFELARMFSGDPESMRDEMALERSHRFLRSSGFGAESAYGVAAKGLIDVLVNGKERMTGADRAIQVATRRGDGVVLAWLLAGGAAADLRRGAYERAVVRGKRAVEVARKANATEAARLARVAVAGAECCVGTGAHAKASRLGSEDAHEGTIDGPGSLRDGFDSGDDAFFLACAMLSAAGDDDQSRVDGLRGKMGELTCDFALATVIDLLSCCGDSGKRLESNLPSDWKEALARMRQMRVASGIVSSVQPEPDESELQNERLFTRDGMGVLEIDLLGGLVVRLGGKVLPDSAWKRRKSAVILAMLAASPRHSCSRFEMIEAFWPESDYAAGRNCLYSALSSLRRAIGQPQVGERYLLTGNGMIQLNPGCVSCDVDRFEAAATAALKHEDDEWVVERCREADELYKGDLYLPSFDATGVFEARRERLRRLHSDAMIAGAEAALRLGKPREALWFAHDAEEPGSAREDVTNCLMQAYVDLGRPLDAEREYLDYAEKVIEGTSMPPSARIRSLYGRIRRQANTRRPQRIDGEDVARRERDSEGADDEG